MSLISRHYYFLDQALTVVAFLNVIGEQLLDGLVWTLCYRLDRFEEVFKKHSTLLDCPLLAEANLQWIFDLYRRFLARTHTLVAKCDQQGPPMTTKSQSDADMELWKLCTVFRTSLHDNPSISVAKAADEYEDKKKWSNICKYSKSKKTPIKCVIFFSKSLPIATIHAAFLNL
jgi:hypothetical protein